MVLVCLRRHLIRDHNNPKPWAVVVGLNLAVGISIKDQSRDALRILPSNVSTNLSSGWPLFSERISTAFCKYRHSLLFVISNADKAQILI